MAELLSFDDFDDGFGEFEFIRTDAQPTAQQQKEEDDDWGDFVVGSQSPVPSSPPFFDPFPDSNCGQDSVPAAGWSDGRKWEKPRGAIPLSIFGDDDAEAEEETEALHPNTLFGGFASSSASPFPVLAKAESNGVGLKDLIADLYGKAGVGNGGGAANSSDLGQDDDDFDEDGWEFKDASSSLGKEDAGESEFQIFCNRSESAEGANDQLRDSNDERELTDVHAAHDGFTNGFSFDPDVACNQCSPDTSQTDNIKTETGLHSSLKNGDKSIELELWESKSEDTFSNTAVAGSWGQQKTSDAKEEMLIPAEEAQASRNLWENNLDVMPTSTSMNGKEDPFGPFVDFSSPNLDSSGIEVPDSKLHSVVALNEVISNLYDGTGQLKAAYSMQSPTVNGHIFDDLYVNPISTNGHNSLNGHSYFDEIQWELKKPLETIVSDKDFASGVDQGLFEEATQNAFFDLYCRFKEESLLLIDHHLGALKKSHEVARLSGEQDKVLKTNEAIEVAHKKLEEAGISENVCLGKHQQKDACVDQLLEFVKKPHFQAFEQEYSLQERISSAEKDLRAAIGLFEHATSVLHILQLAPCGEQQAYITAWSKIAQVCAEELQLGAIIWKESLGLNVCKHILSQGSRYFVALGEIYRVAEILSASLRLYKPWLLSNVEDSSKVVECLNKCAETWKSSGLEKALESISAATIDLDHQDIAKTLLMSIKLIHDLDECSLLNHDLGHGKIICRLSLLPVDVLQGMKVVAWNGEQYLLKLVNLWTNRISADPLQLPRVQVG